MKDIRVAAVIFNSRAGQSDYNLDRMTHTMVSAKEQGATIICYPEMNITGYGLHKDIRNRAQSIPGRITRRLQEMATAEDVVILAGMAEKNDTSRLFISHLVIEPGQAAKVYRKTHLSPPEQDLYDQGNDIPLFNARGICFGIQLCYDAHFPELSSRMATDGADLIFMPHASPRGTPAEKYHSWMRHLTARAYDNGLYIIACNPVGNNNNGLAFPGVAVGIDPSGTVIHKKLTDRESILCIDIRKEVLDRVRGHRMRYFLPNRRDGFYCR